MPCKVQRGRVIRSTRGQSADYSPGFLLVGCSANVSTPQLVLTALNSSKSAYASFSLSKDVFFDKFTFNTTRAGGRKSSQDAEARFTCQLYNKVRIENTISSLVDVDRH